MKRILVTLFWILTATVICSAQTTFYYPQVANGVLGATKWRTTIFFTNPASSGTASGTIRFTQEVGNIGLAGTAFNISFTDEGGAPSTGTINFSIPAGAIKKYVSDGNGAYAGGFARVDALVGTVNGTAIFSEFSLGDALIAEAGVPAVPAVQRQSIFVDTVGGFNIGVAYVNTSDAAASVTLRLLNSAAGEVQTTAATVGTLNHKADFVSELFPGLPQMTGSMQITSTVPIAAIALRFASTGVFTTLPPVTLASLINPAVEWLEQRPWLAPLTSVAHLLGAFQLRIG